MAHGFRRRTVRTRHVGRTRLGPQRFLAGPAQHSRTTSGRARLPAARGARCHDRALRAQPRRRPRRARRTAPPRRGLPDLIGPHRRCPRHRWPAADAGVRRTRARRDHPSMGQRPRRGPDGDRRGARLHGARTQPRVRARRRRADDRLAHRADRRVRLLRPRHRHLRREPPAPDHRHDAATATTSAADRLRQLLRHRNTAHRTDRLGARHRPTHRRRDRCVPPRGRDRDRRGD